MGVLIVPNNVDLSNREEIVKLIKVAGLVFRFDVVDDEGKRLDFYSALKIDRKKCIDSYFSYWDYHIDVHLGKVKYMEDMYGPKNGCKVGIMYNTHDTESVSHIVSMGFFELIHPRSLKGKPNITGYREAYVEETADTPAYMKSYKIEMYDKY